MSNVIEMKNFSVNIDEKLGSGRTIEQILVDVNVISDKLENVTKSIKENIDKVYTSDLEDESSASGETASMESVIAVNCDKEDETNNINVVDSEDSDEVTTLSCSASPKEMKMRMKEVRSDDIKITLCCEEREMPLLNPEEGTEEEDRGTGYNFGKKWSYVDGNYIWTSILYHPLLANVCEAFGFFSTKCKLK